MWEKEHTSVMKAFLDIESRERKKCDWLDIHNNIGLKISDFIICKIKAPKDHDLKPNQICVKNEQSLWRHIRLKL